MARTGWIDNLNRDLLDERSAYAEHRNSRSFDNRLSAQQNLLETLRADG